MALLTAKDIMSSPVQTVEPEDTVLACAKILDKRNIGSVVIVKDGSVKGILTERDIVRRVLAKGRDESATRARDIMTKTVVTVGPDASILDVSNVMHKHYFRHVLVVSHGQLLGVVTAKDIIRVCSVDRVKAASLLRQVRAA